MPKTPDSIRWLVQADFSFDDAEALRRAAMTLHRWHEEECNGTIERDEASNKPYRVIDDGRSFKRTRYLIADRERGALKRIAAIMARYPGWASYVQGDPRGASLYILSPDTMARYSQGGERTIDTFYSQGIAVYK